MSETNDKRYEDNYCVFHDEQQAIDKYEELLLRADLYIVTLTKSVQSTDYEEGTWLVIYTVDVSLSAQAKLSDALFSMILNLNTSDSL